MASEYEDDFHRSRSPSAQSSIRSAYAPVKSKVKPNRSVLQDLINKLTDREREIEELKRENKTLGTISRRQERTINQLDEKQEDADGSAAKDAEIAMLSKSIKAYKDKWCVVDKELKKYQRELQRFKEKNDELTKLVADKGLRDRSALQSEIDELKTTLLARDLHVAKLEKQLDIITKLHKHHDHDKMKEIASLKGEMAKAHADFIQNASRSSSPTKIGALQKQRVDVSSSKIPAKTTHPGYANPAVLLREPPVRQAASRSVPPSPLMAPIPATTSPAPVSYRTSPLPIQQAIIREAQAVTSALRRTEELQDQLQRESTETQARLAVVQREEEKRMAQLREDERLAQQQLEENAIRRQAEEAQVQAAATKARLEDEQRQQWLELDRRQTRERAQAATEEEERLLIERNRVEAEAANRVAIEKAKEERRKKDALLAKMRESHENREGADKNYYSSSFGNAASMVATTASLAYARQSEGIAVAAPVAATTKALPSWLASGTLGTTVAAAAAVVVPTDNGPYNGSTFDNMHKGYPARPDLLGTGVPSSASKRLSLVQAQPPAAAVPSLLPSNSNNTAIPASSRRQGPAPSDTAKSSPKGAVKQFPWESQSTATIASSTAPASKASSIALPRRAPTKKDHHDDGLEEISI